MPRSTDFTNLLRQHSGAVGIGVNNWAALMINGDTYEVISRSNHSGSVGSNGEFVQDKSGKPGAWLLKIDCEELVGSLIPISGLVSNVPSNARFVANTSTLIVAKAQHPDDGLPAARNMTDS